MKGMNVGESAVACFKELPRRHGGTVKKKKKDNAFFLFILNAVRQTLLRNSIKALHIDLASHPRPC
jgi:hypothetical protein